MKNIEIYYRGGIYMLSIILIITCMGCLLKFNNVLSNSNENLDSIAEKYFNGFDSKH